jgi:hypothetical protein
MEIFVSYSTRDDSAVGSLVRDLERGDRHNVWRDEKLAVGEAWWEAILERIRQCTVFVFALSENSLQSKPCRAEADYAEQLGLPILPVQIGEVESYRDDSIFTKQLIDYRQPTGADGIELWEALQNLAARKKDLPDPLPDPPPIPFEYLLLIGEQIKSREPISFSEQTAILTQLRQSFWDEKDPGVRADIRKLLKHLRNRADVTVAAVREIDFLVQSGSAGSTTAPVTQVDQESSVDQEPSRRETRPSVGGIDSDADAGPAGRAGTVSGDTPGMPGFSTSVVNYRAQKRSGGKVWIGVAAAVAGVVILGGIITTIRMGGSGSSTPSHSVARPSYTTWETNLPSGGCLSGDVGLSVTSCSDSGAKYRIIKRVDTIESCGNSLVAVNYDGYLCFEKM